MTAATLVLDPDVARPDPDPTRPVRHRLVTALAVTGPVLFTASNVLLPKITGDTAHAVRQMQAHADRLVAVELLYAVASLLYLPLAAALLRPDTRRGAWLRLAGAVLLVVGAVGNAFGEVVQGYGVWAMHHAGVDVAAQTRVFDQLSHGAITLPISYAAIPVLAVGGLLLLVGVMRSRCVPTWLPWAAIAGMVLSIPVGVGLPALVGLVSAAAFAVIVVRLP